MKIDELKSIIYEEVRKAIRTELRDILTESNPSPVTNKKPLPVEASTKNISISDMLQETLRGMTREDYMHVLGSGKPFTSDLVVKDNSAVVGGYDPELPAFAMKAKSILDASNNVDRERHAV